MLIQNTAVAQRVLHRAYFEWLLAHGIQDDETLQHFCEVYLGSRLPQEPFCPEHRSPFAFLSDQFFERERVTFGFANRSGGKTWTVAMLNVLDLIFKPGVEIASAGAIKEQAQRSYEYMVAMLGREPLDEMIYKSSQAYTELVNGSQARILIASWHGLNSPHPQKFRADEIELIHPQIMQEAYSMAQTKGGWKAQTTLTSTRKFPSGSVQKLIDEADKRHIRIIPWCIFETVERCERLCKGDPTYGDCPAYSRIDKDGEERMLCGGRAHDVPGGWYKLDDMIEKASLLDAETFQAQWLNLRPSSGALVYGQWFDAAPPFVLTTEEAKEILAKRAANRDAWPRVYGIDFGANFALAAWIQDPATEIWYKYWEYFFAAEKDRPISEHAAFIKANDPLGYDARRTYVFADPSGRQAIRDLETFGIWAVPANNDLYAGTNHVKMLMQRPMKGQLPKFRVFSSCKNTIREITQTYLHVLKKDGTPDRDRIQPKNNHNCDADRYALFSWVTVATGRYRMRKLRGVW